MFQGGFGGDFLKELSVVSYQLFGVNPVGETICLADSYRSMISSRRTDQFPSPMVPADEAEASSAGEQLAKE